jgi:hypothetical protein
MSELDPDKIWTYPPLPVTEILCKGLSAPFVHFKNIFRVAYPLCALLFGSLVLEYLAEDSTWEGLWPVAGVLVVFAIFAFALAAIVGCHRLFILGADSILGHPVVWFSESQWRYFGWSWALGFLVFISILPLVFFVGQDISETELSIRSLSAQLVISLPPAYILGRLSLLLPAAATNYLPELNLGWGWNLSRGNEMSLFLIVGLIPILTELIMSLLPTSESLVYELMVVAVWLYVALVELAFLSYSFEFLTRKDT